MWSLSELKKMNQKVVKLERMTCDHSSYTTFKGDVILHSGKHRSTLVLRGPVAKLFIRDWNDIPSQSLRTKHMPAHVAQAKRDALVESYF